VFGDSKFIIFSAVWALSIASQAVSQTPARVEKAIVSVETSLDTDRTYVPGDVVELKVFATSRSYVEMLLEPPVHAHARLLEIQPFPITLNADRLFQREWMALYQIGRSGSLVLDGGSVGLNSEAILEDQQLSAISLVVGSVGMDPGGDAPEIWSGTTSASGAGMALIIAAFFALGISMYLAYHYWLKRNLTEASGLPVDSAQAQASRICESLKRDNFNPRELERFLAMHQEECSGRLVALIEKLLYARKSPVGELLDQFREEFAE